MDNHSEKSISVVIGEKEHTIGYLLNQDSKKERNISLIDSNKMVAEGLIYEGENYIARLRSNH